MDGFRRFLIATALNIKGISFVILKGWRGDPHQVMERERAYIREVNNTARILNLQDRKQMARKLLGEDENRFLAGEVKYRQSYGLIAAQTGLSQQTVEVLERDHCYIRYRARCEGEPRLRGDSRLRSTTPIPPGERLDEADAWRRGFSHLAGKKRSVAGLLEAAEERRRALAELSEGLERQEQEALLEDALSVLMPKMEILDRQKQEDKQSKEAAEKAQTEANAKREAEIELERKKRYVEESPGVGSESAPERPDRRVATLEESKRPPERSVALQRFTAACDQLDVVAGLLTEVDWAVESVQEWVRLGKQATDSLREIWRAVPDLVQRDWSGGF